MFVGQSEKYNLVSKVFSRVRDSDDGSLSCGIWILLSCIIKSVGFVATNIQFHSSSCTCYIFYLEDKDGCLLLESEYPTGIFHDN